MAQVKFFYDDVGETLTVWFDDPALEEVCEETAEEIILIKDRIGRVIGFEKLNFKASDPEHLAVAAEMSPRQASRSTPSRRRRERG